MTRRSMGLRCAVACSLLVACGASRAPSIVSEPRFPAALASTVERLDATHLRITSVRVLIEEPYGNQHLVSLRASSGTLDLAHRVAHRGEHSLSHVPWDDIVHAQVRHSIASLYSAIEERTLPRDPLADAGCSAPEPGARCEPLGEGRALLAMAHALESRDASGRTEWSVALPEGHTAIDIAPIDGWIWIATRSHQGHVDGELLQPHDVTWVFAILDPAQNDDE